MPCRQHKPFLLLLPAPLQFIKKMPLLFHIGSFLVKQPYRLDNGAAPACKTSDHPNIKHESRRIQTALTDQVNQVQIGRALPDHLAETVDRAHQKIISLLPHGITKPLLQLPVEQLPKPGRHPIQVDILGSLIGTGTPGQIDHFVIPSDPLMAIPGIPPIAPYPHHIVQRRPCNDQ